ncbi:MAG: hypothetical protein V1738_01930 [Patescibacteria group bacterium]
MYLVVLCSAEHELLVLDDLEAAGRGRPDRYLVFDRDHILHDVRHRIARADDGETSQVFDRTDRAGIEPYLRARTVSAQSTMSFRTVADAWRWLRLEQAKKLAEDVRYYDERLKNDPGNKFFRSMLNEQRAEIDQIRRRFP